MTDDALIAGAAAPTRRRRIMSAVRLDAAWVIVTSAALVVSSFADLIDLPDARLRTGDAPLRVFVVGIPLVAGALGVMAALRRSERLSTVATGVLVPGVALAGSLSASLFLDDASAFADAGLAVSLAAALLGLVMLVRWFVYHPLSLLGREERPWPAASRGVVGLGAAVALYVVGSGLGDGVDVAWSAETAAMLLVPAVVIAGGLVRTVAAVELAASAAAAQIVAVVVVAIEQPEIAFDSDLRTGVIGAVGLAVAIVLAVVAVRRATPDVAQRDADDDATWRWSADD